MLDVIDALPNEPASIEARGMLLSGRGSVVLHDGAVLVLHAPAERLATIHGPFRWDAVSPVLLGRCGEVEVITREAEFRRAGPLPFGWKAEPAIVFAEPERVTPPRHAKPVTFFSAADPPDLRHVPRDLRQELERAVLFSPLAGALEGDLAVSFCYAGWETESWWDVSVDTLAPWRGRGFARAAATALMAHMRRHGKRAVWAALESNEPSLRLARSLRFEAVARLVITTC